MRVAVFVLALASFALAKKPIYVIPEPELSSWEVIDERPESLLSNDGVQFVPRSPLWIEIMEKVPVKYTKVIERVYAIYIEFTDPSKRGLDNSRIWVVYEGYHNDICVLSFESVKGVNIDFTPECNLYSRLPARSSRYNKKHPTFKIHKQSKKHPVDSSIKK